MADDDRSGLTLLDAVLVVGGGVIAIVVVFAFLSFIAGLVWFFIKAIAVIAVIVGLAWLLFRRRS